MSLSRGTKAKDSIEQPTNTHLSVKPKHLKLSLSRGTKAKDSIEQPTNTHLSVKPKHLKLSLSRGTKAKDSIEQPTNAIDQSREANTAKREAECCITKAKDSIDQPTNAHRFAKPFFFFFPECEKAAKGGIPANTEASTQWAVRTFNAWALNRSFLDPSEAVPNDLLESHDPELVCKWLCRFLLETRKSDGYFYPPATLRSLVCGVNCVLQQNKALFSASEKADHRCRDLLKNSQFSE